MNVGFPSPTDNPILAVPLPAVPPTFPNSRSVNLPFLEIISVKFLNAKVVNRRLSRPLTCMLSVGFWRFLCRAFVGVSINLSFS